MNCTAPPPSQKPTHRPTLLPADSLFALVLTVLSTAFHSLASTNLSVWAYPGPSGRLLYKADFLGNRILDTSGVGYKGGLVPLPSSNTVPVKATVSPVGGDNTA